MFVQSFYLILSIAELNEMTKHTPDIIDLIMGTRPNERHYMPKNYRELCSLKKGPIKGPIPLFGVKIFSSFRCLKINLFGSIYIVKAIESYTRHIPQSCPNQHCLAKTTK